MARHAWMSGKARGKMQHKATRARDDVRPDLQQALAQRRDLRAGVARARGVEPELVHQDVGGGRQEHPQLVGPEARATRPSGLEAVVQFFDPVLDPAITFAHELDGHVGTIIDVFGYNIGNMWNIVVYDPNNESRALRAERLIRDLRRAPTDADVRAVEILLGLQAK